MADSDKSPDVPNKPTQPSTPSDTPSDTPSTRIPKTPSFDKPDPRWGGLVLKTDNPDDRGLFGPLTTSKW